MLDDATLYQLEVKLPSIDGVSQTQVINLKGCDQLWFSERADFPETGNNIMLYIATDEGIIYIWWKNDYLAMDGGAADILDRLKDLEINKVDYGLYESHTHNVTMSGVGNEVVISKVNVITGEITQVTDVGRMPGLTSEWREGQVVELIWTEGQVPTLGTKTVVTNVESESITPTFSGTAVTSTPSGQVNYIEVASENELPESAEEGTIAIVTGE